MLGGVGRLLGFCRCFGLFEAEAQGGKGFQHRCIDRCTLLSLYVSTMILQSHYARFTLRGPRLHSLALFTGVSGVCISVHCFIASTSFAITFRSIPARRQTLTRSSPAGTVGGTTGLTMNPLSSRKVESACGVGVRSPMIGAGGFESRSARPLVNGPTE